MGPREAGARALTLAIRELASPNHDDRPCPVDMLVLHYTGMRTAQAAVERLRDPVARVSSHYVVDEDGSVLRLVAEGRRAWHAGVSFWQGRRGLNDCSIGIEIVNPGHEWGYRPFPPAQMRAVRALCLDILGRHAIPASRVLGHSDVAPDRKQDPGELFDWRGLAADGIGLWPAADEDSADEAPADEVSADEVIAADAALDRFRLDAILEAIGYDPGLDRATTLRAFQRHWRPEAIDGRADAATRHRLAAVRMAMAELSPI